jgi:hypothetical protein
MVNNKKKNGADAESNFPVSTLSLTLKPEFIPSFFLFLQKGIPVKVQAGSSIRAFLVEQLGLSDSYIDERVQILFLDGKPVDALDSAVIKDGSTLALSAASPGLLGAMLRKGSYYKQMRSQISYKQDSEKVPKKEGMVVLKLFNLLTKELGPSLLKQGVWIQGKDLQYFFKRQPDRFWAGCRKALLNGEAIDLKELAARDWPPDYVFLKLEET